MANPSDDNPSTRPLLTEEEQDTEEEEEERDEEKAEQLESEEAAPDGAALDSIEQANEGRGDQTAERNGGEENATGNPTTTTTTTTSPQRQVCYGMLGGVLGILLFWMVADLIDLIGSIKWCDVQRGPIITKEIVFPSPITYIWVEVPAANVFISKATKQKVTVTSTANVINNVMNGEGSTLLISSYSNCIHNIFELEVNIEIPELKAIRVDEGTVKMNNSIPGLTNLWLRGSGSIAAASTHNNQTYHYEPSMRVVMCGDSSGNITLSGSTAWLELDMGDMGEHCYKNKNQSGNFNAFGFQAQRADCVLKGNGSAFLSVRKELDVKLMNSGSLFYKGNPNVTTNITGSGKVVHVTTTDEALVQEVFID